MDRLQSLYEEYGNIDCRDLSSRQLEVLRDRLKEIPVENICSASDGSLFIELLRKFREAVAENAKLNGDNYPQLLNSLLSVGEDGLYSNNLRFIFELIQNVDDCEYLNPEDCSLKMRFDFNRDEITLTYNEVGFTPFNVFAITGIAEAAKNISEGKTEIGEKGIGFKSVFGVADHVRIRSGWFCFGLFKNNFTIPIPEYDSEECCPGTEMVLSVPGKAQVIYNQIKNQYCNSKALFGRNPLLFLNKLTSLRLYFDQWDNMEFKVSRTQLVEEQSITREDNVRISVCLNDRKKDKPIVEQITCSRYTYPVTFSYTACQSRYGENTKIGSKGGKHMLLQAVIPNPENVNKAGEGGLYSFLPTQLRFSAPIVCHAPFKLDASREFVDPQGKNDEDCSLWFQNTSDYLSELLDYVYQDWSKKVKQNIVFYLPQEIKSLFAKNNGKEECLRKQEVFTKKHYLALPLFYTETAGYKTAAEVFSFSHQESIGEPEKIARLLNLKKALFIAPGNKSVDGFGITIERDIHNRLFQHALNHPHKTAEILEYLDGNEFEYTENLFSTEEDVPFDASQIISFLKHSKMAELMQRIAANAIKRGGRPRFKIEGIDGTHINDIPNCDFGLNETPKRVENYMTYCNEYAFCLEIAEGAYLPCKNGIVLSKQDPLSSFSAFCFKLDPDDTFAIRMRLREKSKQLDLCVENDSGSASDFLRDLMNIRLTVKDSLGKDGYKSYTDLIIRSGTSPNRFLHELLQNADDCQYPAGTIPTFKLQQRDSFITTEYNEVGFTRANLRAITAIGESTKNSLIDGDYDTIGKKGVGFKSVFAVASIIRVFSGEYNFSLSEEAPTVPKQINAPERPIRGTKMEFTLRNKTLFTGLKTTEILELCLCLRRLKNLEIDNHKILISDTETQRTLAIDNREFVFDKYVHSFIVEDDAVLDQHSNKTRSISAQQKITCYVPQAPYQIKYALYCGLPTKHKFNVPIEIDAPFELTTSREYIEGSSDLWNAVIRKELYAAVIEVIHHRKTEERTKVLRFCRVDYQGNKYVNFFSDSSYLNQFPYLELLRNERILPTFERSRFVSIAEKHANKYPEAITLLLALVPTSSSRGFSPDVVIDSKTPEDVSKELKERIESVFKALGCENAPFSQVFSIIKQFAESNITDVAFRNSLYEYLQEAPYEYHSEIAKLKILPTFGINGGVDYICWNGNEIFVRRNTSKSSSSYRILFEDILPKSMCEKMLGVNINEMNAEWERNCYRQELERIVRGSDINRIYAYIMQEFQSGNLKRNDCSVTLKGLKADVPLKNELGQITRNELFVSSLPQGYFPSEMIQRITVHEECVALANFISSRKLSDVHSEDFNYNESLTADDIECLRDKINNDDFFIHSEEILRRFYRNGLIADKLMAENNIEYIGMSFDIDSDAHYSFPEQPVVDRQKLIAHVKTECNSPVSIVSEKVERSVLKGQLINGKSFFLDGDEARKRTLDIYTPIDSKTVAFCQMCQKIKPHKLMEVNNLEIRPKYYFHQTRVALCLECSKRFEAMREDARIRDSYLETIKNTSIANQGSITIPIHGSDSLKFTATHLAEIQEILKWIHAKELE